MKKSRSFYIRIDPDLADLLTTEACITKIARGNLVAKCIAEGLGVELNPDYSLNIESAEAYEKILIQKQIEKLNNKLKELA